VCEMCEREIVRSAAAEPHIAPSVSKTHVCLHSMN
jgi:hypothetical protein